MRVFTLIPLTAFLFVSAPAIAQQGAREIKRPGFFSRARFETKYDKFKDQTTVRFKRVPITGTTRRVFAGETLYLVGAFAFPGSELKAPVDTAYLGFLSESKDWIYLRDQHLIALVDGQRVDLGTAETGDSDVRLGGVTELLAFRVSHEMLLKVANGSKVEMQLGSREFKLKDNHLYALQDLANRMRSGNPKKN